MIRWQQAALRRGSQLLFEEATLAVNPGERVGIVGQNGTGKSSLFELLSDRIQLDAGEVQIPKGWRIAQMAQEVDTVDCSALDYVLDGNVVLREVEKAIAQAEENDRLELLGSLYNDYDVLGGYDAQYKAEQLLHGLGFLQEQISKPVSHFSGGWRIRLNLARALMMPSDLLLLDEPTNHLDLDATLWLEQWLKGYEGTLLFISHDRDFLDAVAQGIIHIEQQRLQRYTGNYSKFEVQRAEQLSQQQANFEKQQKRIQEIDSFVRRFRAKATKARQAQSRLKELERMDKLAPAHVDSPFNFSFKPPERFSDPLMTLQDVTLGYKDTTILSDVNLSLHPSSRIGLLGVNGAGKSTLIKGLVGDLTPLIGEVVKGEHLNIGYFAQHQLEALDIDASAYTHIQRLSPEASEQAIRKFLGGFNFQGDKALEPIKPFSGGEKARLALAMVVWTRPNFLLLDEPTNHLDLEMRHALNMALQTYEGALVIISHDRYLLRNTVDEFYLVAEGGVEPFDGDLPDYQQWIKNQEAKKASSSKKEPHSKNKNKKVVMDKKSQRQKSALGREQKKTLTKMLKKQENAIDKAQKELTHIETALADSGVYEEAQKEKLKGLIQQQTLWEKNLKDAEEAWLEASEALE